VVVRSCTRLLVERILLQEKFKPDLDFLEIMQSNIIDETRLAMIYFKNIP